MIVVAGATGNVGGELVRLLAERGEPVRGLVRAGRQAALPAGVAAAVGDLDRPETLRPALDGAAGVFLLSGYQDMPGVLAEVRRAGAGRVVLLSGAAVEATDTDNAISRYMLRSEATVRESGVPWTFLRPRTFMTNMLAWAPQVQAGDVVRGPFADVPVAVVDPHDIAAVAAAALLAPGHEGRAYPLTGPESLLPADRVRVLAEVLGRDLRFEGQSRAAARAEMSATVPAEYVDAFVRFFGDGTVDESTVHPTVPAVTGRPARTFREWASAHAAAFGRRE